MGYLSPLQAQNTQQSNTSIERIPTIYAQAQTGHENGQAQIYLPLRKSLTATVEGATGNEDRISGGLVYHVNDNTDLSVIVDSRDSTTGGSIGFSHRKPSLEIHANVYTMPDEYTVGANAEILARLINKNSAEIFATANAYGFLMENTEDIAGIKAGLEARYNINDNFQLFAQGGYNTNARLNHHNKDGGEIYGVFGIRIGGGSNGRNNNVRRLLPVTQVGSQEVVEDTPTKDPTPQTPGPTPPGPTPPGPTLDFGTGQPGLNN